MEEIKSEVMDQIKVFDGTAKDIVAQGGAMVQSKAGFHTAVRVQKPRDLDDVVTAVEKEAGYAADNFYYSWMVKDKRSGTKKPIIGGTIGCAMAIARNWQNCVITMDVQDFPGYWIFTPSFVDLETGFTITRSFKKSKPRSAVGDYDNERYEDMMFQKGQSQAIRNVIFAGVPSWLKNKAVAKAQEASKAGINKDGLDKARNKAVDWLTTQGVTKEQIKAVFDKPLADFSLDDVQMLRNLCQQIMNGDTTLEEAFPPLETKTAVKETTDAEKKPEKAAKAKKETKAKPAPEEVKVEPEKKEEVKPDQDPGMSEDHGRMIARELYDTDVSAMELCAHFGVKRPYEIPDSKYDDAILSCSPKLALT